MRVLVCGGREHVTDDQVFAVLDALRCRWPLELEIGEGGAIGVDKASGRWAEARGIAHRCFPVDDAVDGGKDDAPKRRNKRMLDVFQPHLVVGFPGGGGTRHMMRIAHEAGVEVLDVEFTRKGGVEIFQWSARAGAPRNS